MAEVKRCESGSELLSASFPWVNNSSWTAEADTAKEFTVNLPGSENTIHPGKSGSLALPSNPQNNLLIFLKGQPQVLGVAQILIGLMELCLWVTTVASYTKLSYRGSDLNFIIVTGYPVWGSLFFFTSGALSIAAGKKVTKGLIQGSLGMNTISAIIAGIGIIILMTETSITWEKSKERFFEERLSTGLVTVLLILSLLEACIALSLSIFGCRVACIVSQVVIYLPSQDNMDSVVSPEHIYDDVIF